MKMDICAGCGGEAWGCILVYFGQGKIARFLPVFLLDYFAKLPTGLIACYNLKRFNLWSRNKS